MPCIESVVAGHFKVFFGYVLDQQANEFNGRESPLYISIIFMSVVMKGDIFAIIGINTIQSDHRPPEISADVFDNGIGITQVWFCINVEAIFILLINESFDFFERGTDTFFQCI